MPTTYRRANLTQIREQTQPLSAGDDLTASSYCSDQADMESSFDILVKKSRSTTQNVLTDRDSNCFRYTPVPDCRPRFQKSVYDTLE